MENLDDKLLVERTLSGDRSAYRVLVERYQSRMFSMAFELLKNRADAEDITQESFVKAFLSLNDFRGDSSFYTWLYRIVYNMVVDFRRKVKRRGGQAEELDERSTNEQALAFGKLDSPDAAVLRKEQGRLIRRALDSLSEDHRAVMLLREVDGLSYEEIAKVTGVSLGTVMSRLFYGRKKMQQMLSDISPSGGIARDKEEKRGEKGKGENFKGQVAVCACAVFLAGYSWLPFLVR